MNYLKQIHIGNLIHTKFKELEISIDRTSKFLKCPADEIENMFLQKSLDTETLLRWSKLLEYDFFRLYSQHLILYAPPSKIEKRKNDIPKPTSLPQFKKNIYTKEVIDFILERILTKEKTVQEIISEYKIPKTTLYKWINKYSQNK